MEKPGWIIIGAAFALFVCVGLFNIGACRSEQQSVSTTTRTQSPSTPWPAIVVISVIILLVVGAVVLAAKPDEQLR